MVIVLATIESTAEDIAALEDAIIEMQRATATEPGNISYDFTVEIGNKNNIKVIERWETLEDLAAHFHTPHMAEFNAAMVNHPPKNVIGNAYEIEKEVPIPMPG